MKKIKKSALLFDLLGLVSPFVLHLPAINCVSIVSVDLPSISDSMWARTWLRFLQGWHYFGITVSNLSFASLFVRLLIER